jgi:hypothetical protein
VRAWEGGRVQDRDADGPTLTVYLSSEVDSFVEGMQAVVTKKGPLSV